MRIGVLISGWHGGGAEMVARTWVRTLRKRGHEVFSYGYGKPYHHRGLEDLEVEYYDGATKLRRTFGLAGWIREQAVSDRLEVFVSLLTHSNLALIGAFIGRERPTLLISERNLAGGYLHLEGLGGRLQLRTARTLYRTTDGFIAISHAVAAEAISTFQMPQQKVSVVPNPTWNGEIGETSRSEKGRLIFAGRMVEQKRPELFVRVVDELGRLRGTPQRAVMIGDGPLKEDLRGLANKMNLDIDFPGWLEPWWQYAERDDVSCLLMTSSVEGFGNVLVEAAARGIPSVALSQAVGVADAVIPGVTGYLVNADTPQALARAVLATSSLPMRTDSISEWLTRFSVDNSTDELEQAIVSANESRVSV